MSFFGGGRVFVRPLDPRDGNEWREVGEVVSIEARPATVEEEIRRALERAQADLELMDEIEEQS